MPVPVLIVCVQSPVVPYVFVAVGKVHVVAGGIHAFFVVMLVAARSMFAYACCES